MGDGMELEFIQNWKSFNLNQQPLLVAVSTGVDSMVLLHLLLKLPVELRPQITVGYVNHCLRKQSKVETQFIQEYCNQHHLPLRIGVWDSQQHPLHGIEEAAREFRYTFFSKVMDELQIKTLATAHHADDLAETFLMKLLRGGELSQLIGIEAQRAFNDSKQLIRPLLPYSKQQLYDYANQHHLTYFEDETNYQDDILRNRIRHHIIPKLKQENPRFLRHVYDYTTQLKMTLKINQQILQEQLKGLTKYDKVDLKAWIVLSSETRRAILKEYFIQHDVSIQRRQFEEIIKFLENTKKPQGIFQLSAKKILVKGYEDFYLTIQQKKLKPDSDNQCFLIENGKLIQTTAFKLTLECDLKANADKWVKFSQLPSGLCLRHRVSGDWLRINHGTKKLSRFLIDKKIPQDQRQTLWVIADKQQEVYALFGNCLNSMIYLSQPVENATIRYMIAIKYRKR